VVTVEPKQDGAPHVVPGAAAGLLHVPVAGSQVPATWHWSSGMQVTAVPAVQTPLWQVSFWVQALPSLQDVPSPLAGLEHVPVLGLHVPAVWHWSEAVQTTGVPPVQTPAVQVVPVVQALPSSHAVPSSLFAYSHWPVEVLQMPACLQGLVGSGQTIGVCAQPVTASQLSTVQGLPSSQIFGVLTQPVWGLQVSTVHALLSSQTTGVWTQPIAGSQESTVHRLLSVQLTGVPPPQTPAVQVSPETHLLPLLQALPSALFAYSH
jgi:hypothetical protein